MLYPEVASPRARSSTTTPASRRCCCRTWPTGPLTLKRYPDGVEGKSFFEKNSPSHRPDWVRTVELPSPGSTKNRETIDYTVIDGLPALVWAANLATLELHTPMWTVGPRGGVHNPTCWCSTSTRVRRRPWSSAARSRCSSGRRLAEDGLEAYAKTAGSKGLQLYVPHGRQASVGGRPRLLPYGGRAASLGSHPKLVVSNMKKDLRGGKVLVDWSQNNGAKTTVTVYSLRAGRCRPCRRRSPGTRSRRVAEGAPMSSRRARCSTGSRSTVT